MVELDIFFVKKGINEPREGLRDEAIVHAGLGRKYAPELGGCGWTPENTAEIETMAAALGSRVAEQADAKVAAKSKTQSEKVARANAKELIGKIRLGTSILVGKGLADADAKEKLEAGHTLGQSTPRIAMYLEKIAPTVAALDEPLKIYFGGENPSTLLASARAALDAAEATQETDLGALPRETREIYEAKGRLLARIEEMNKVGKIAFYGRTEIAGLFNKDILNRARKTITKTATTTA